MVLLLVPHGECAELLQQALSDRFDSGDIRLEVVTQPAQDAILESRQKFGGIPVGFVAEDEVGALEALTNGADEVLMWPPRDGAAIQGFLDRTTLRATLRRRQERRSAAVAHSEKLAALGTLVAGVAHEINNPLTVIRFGLEACTTSFVPLSKMAMEVANWAERGWGASAEQIQELHQRAFTGTPANEDEKMIEEMLSATISIANIVRDLRIFSRSDSEREESSLLDAHSSIDQALRLVGRQISTAARIERDYERDLPQVLVPPGRLVQVLINLLVNAAHAIEEVQRPVHRVRIVTRTDGEYVAISIADTGPGIPPQAVERIFDPFYTTKRSGQGTGLGLSISRSIMQELGGDLIVESVHGSGATFILMLPIPDRATVHNAQKRTSRRAPESIPRIIRHTVLLVDDDEHVLSAYARALSRSYDVLMASDGQEAIDLLRSGSNADALITELALPDLDGKELFEWVCSELPDLARRTVFVTAEATAHRYQAFIDTLENAVLLKPVTTRDLQTSVDEVIKSEQIPGDPRPFS
jgi:two-component system NtrC family sensor kinase